MKTIYKRTKADKLWEVTINKQAFPVGKQINGFFFERRINRLKVFFDQKFNQ